MSNQTKLRPDLTTFSVSSPELALFAGLWLEAHGCLVADNLKTESKATDEDWDYFMGAGYWLIGRSTLNSNRFSWLGRKRADNHFVDAASLINWLLDTPKLPAIGGYQPTISEDGLQVGCTKVSFETFEVLAKEVEKFRARLSKPLNPKHLTAEDLSKMTDFSKVRAELRDYGTYTMTEKGGRYAFINDGNKITHLDGWHNSQRECCLSAVQDSATVLYTEDDHLF